MAAFLFSIIPGFGQTPSQVVVGIPFMHTLFTLTFLFYQTLLSRPLCQGCALWAPQCWDAERPTQARCRLETCLLSLKPVLKPREWFVSYDRCRPVLNTLFFLPCHWGFRPALHRNVDLTPLQASLSPAQWCWTFAMPLSQVTLGK